MSTASQTSQGGLFCKARNKQGARCGCYALSEGGGYCFSHDPSKAAERFAARSRGGRARHNRTLKTASGGDQVHHLRTVADVVELLEAAVSDLLTLENSISRARACGYLAGIAVKALEVSDLEDRIAALEQQVGG